MGSSGLQPGVGGGAPALTGLEDYEGFKRLVSDLRIVLLLADEARDAVMARLFGVAKDDSALISIIAVALLVAAARDKGKAMVGLPVPGSSGDALIGVSALRESAHWLAGDLYRDTPIFGTLIAIAFLGTAIKPVLGFSFKELRVGVRDVRQGFDNRYGHLVRRRLNRR
jgi:hypothetical protein